MRLDKTDNLNSSQLNKERNPFLKFIFRIIKNLHLLIPIIMILPESIWIFFISKGYIDLGRLPNYKDSEVVSFYGFDRELLVYSLVIMAYGSLIWIAITIINYFAKMYVISNSRLVFGVITILIFLVLSSSPQFVWLLD